MVDPIRPEWSVIIPVYNGARYLPQAIESVVAQAFSPERMEIVVLDNASTDADVKALVETAGKGRVNYRRNAETIPVYDNFNKAIQCATGRLIHILHADDYVENGFYQAVTDLAANHPAAAMYFTRAYFVDRDREIESITPRLPSLERVSHDPQPLFYANPIQCPMVVVRKEFYDRYGGFNPRFVHTADWELWARAITHGGAIGLNKPLVSYRIHDENLTSQQMKTAENLKDYLLLAETFKKNYEKFDNDAFRKIIASFAFSQARRFYYMGNRKAFLLNFSLFSRLISKKEFIRMMTAHKRLFLVGLFGMWASGAAKS